jgi:hypothetical protein
MRVGILGNSILTSTLMSRILSNDQPEHITVIREPEPELPPIFGMSSMDHMFRGGRTNVEDAAQGLMARSNRIKGKRSASHRARSNKRKANN